MTRLQELKLDAEYHKSNIQDYKEKITRAKSRLIVLETQISNWERNLAHEEEMEFKTLKTIEGWEE